MPNFRTGWSDEETQYNTAQSRSREQVEEQRKDKRKTHGDNMPAHKHTERERAGEEKCGRSNKHTARSGVQRGR